MIYNCLIVKNMWKVYSLNIFIGYFIFSCGTNKINKTSVSQNDKSHKEISTKSDSDLKKTNSKQINYIEPKTLSPSRTVEIENESIPEYEKTKLPAKSE
jgi:hypothetical protein